MAFFPWSGFDNTIQEKKTKLWDLTSGKKNRKLGLAFFSLVRGRSHNTRKKNRVMGPDFGKKNRKVGLPFFFLWSDTIQKKRKKKLWEQRGKKSLFIQPRRAHVARTRVLPTLKAQRQVFLCFTAPAGLTPWKEDLATTHPLAAVSAFPLDFLAFRAPRLRCHQSAFDDLEA